MRKTILLLFMLCCFLAKQYAQNGFTVSGLVEDENGEPLIGVNVIEQGTTNGTITDMDGNYSIQVASEQSVLVFSFIGYLKKEIPVEGRSTINLSLSPILEEIGEVVIVGYGTQRKVDLTSSISTISTEAIDQTPLPNTESLLQGKAAGIQVMSNSGSPGSTVSVKVRGMVTLGNSQPLYVVDGIPMSSGAGDNAFGINSLNPNDIESIQVLKDASSAAIYGSRGSNGVVLITTKRGKSGKMNVNFNAYYGIQTQARKINVLNKQQFKEYYDLVGTVSYADLNDPEAYAELPDFDWQDEIFSNSPMSNMQLSVSGGSEKSNYMMSAANTSQTGMVNTSNYNRTNFRINSDHNVNNWLKIGESFMVSYSKRDRVQESGTGFNGITANPVVTALLSDPMTEAYNELGEWNYMRHTGTFNAAGLRDRANYTYRNKKLNGNIYGEVSFLKDFKIKSNLGVDYNLGEVREFMPAFEVKGSPLNEAQLVPTLKQYDQHTTYLIMENTLTYKKLIERHSITVLAGQTVETNQFYDIGGKNSSMPGNAENLRYINAGDPSDIQLWGGATEWRMFSYLGRINYAFDNRYLLTASVRQDASSRFGPDQRKGIFPAFSVGWRIKKESFLEDVDWLYNAKIRFGWGQVGNQNNIGNFSYNTPIALNANYLFGDPKILFTGVTAGINYQGYGGRSGGKPGNKSLTWETTQTTNIGVDLDFFDGRLSFTSDWFYRDNTGMLLTSSVPSYLGIIGPDINGGKITNQGLEFELGYHKSEGSLLIDISGNLTYISTNVVDLGESTSSNIFSSNNIQGNFLSRTMEGGGIADFWGYKTDGIYRTLEELQNGALQQNAQVGDIRFVDADGDGIITNNDQTVLDSPIPKYTYGLTGNFGFKNFELNLFLQGYYDFMVYNNMYRLMMGRFGLNKHEDILNSWTPDNTNTDIPRFEETSRNQNDRVLSDRWLQDGSFLRLRTISLGYNLPAGFASMLNVANFKLYTTVQNAFVLTKYKGFDPEISEDVSWGENYLDLGVDNGNYPQPRIYLVGLNITF